MSTPVAPWDRIYNDVKIAIPGVTDAVYWQVLYQVLNDFLDRTNIWLEEVPIAVEPDVYSYPFTLVKFGYPNRLMLVYDPALQRPDRQWVQGGVQMDVPGILTLRNSPSTGATWSAVIAKTLDTVSASKAPDIQPSDYWIIDKYIDGVQYGILGRLQAMPGKPYSNTKQGSSNWQIYIAERGKARTDALKANVFGGQRWMFPQGFATVRRGSWA